VTNHKQVRGVYESGAQDWVGDGFPVRNLFPSNPLQESLDPFLLLDYAGPHQFAPASEPRGVGEHPHRGFETVTIVYQGRLEHRDSGGNRGAIGPGDVQWMTAASGVVHEEKHAADFTREGGTLEMVQLWVNLPRAYKMAPPRYQTLRDAEIPRAALPGGGTLRVIAGTWQNARGPARTFTPVHLWDVHLPAGASVELALPAGFHSALVLRRGDLDVEGQRVTGAARLALLSPEGEGVSVRAAEESALLVLSGQPLGEPIVSQGPFVMNTAAEIRQAFEDYRAGRMGHLA
jgi:redox-sensitive bicupin YhaK (pirin superfamily)